MSNEQLEQVEALQQAGPMMERVIGAINRVIYEYSGEKLPDTEEYMHSVLQGLEWVFAVYRGTKSLIDANDSRINQEEVNSYVFRLNAANKAQDDSERAEAFKGILKFVEEFKREADCIVAAA
ncbi:MAG: hypothetical protein ACI4E1_09510 [Lachnospira sp.]